MLLKRVELSAQKTALLRKKAGVWAPTSWFEVGERVFEIAHALKSAGINAGDSVAVLSQTRPAFFFCDLAIQSLAARTVPVYSAVTADDVFLILKDCDARFVFVEDVIQYRKVESVRAQLKKSFQVVILERTQDPALLSLEKFVAASLPTTAELKSKAHESWKDLVKAIPSNEVATIVYTSGTQGLPKGVEITHKNFLVILQGLASTLDLTERDVTLFFLPVAHIMGRVEQMISIAVGLTNAYAENLSSLLDNMSEIKPTVLVSVPRVYEKIFASIQSKFSGENRVTREAFKLALQTGLDYSRTLQAGRNLDPLLRLRYAAADKLFFSKIREKMGGKLRFAFSGGAALSPELAEFFHAFGILILEGYGLTETTGPACLNRPNDFKFGTVGKPIPGCQIALNPGDSEIIITGEVVSNGYHSSVDEHESFYQDHSFHSGDIGEIDKDGFLKIIDRKRDILVTSGGRNIAPQKIKNLFKNDPLFSHIIVIGDGRAFVSALLTIHKSEAKRIAEKLGIAKGDDKGSDSIGQWLESEKFYREVEARVEKINQSLAHHEQVKKFRVLPRDLTVEAGELTPSLKVRRKFCTEKYASLIESMYV